MYVGYSHTMCHCVISIFQIPKLDTKLQKIKNCEDSANNDKNCGIENNNAIEYKEENALEDAVASEDTADSGEDEAVSSAGEDEESGDKDSEEEKVQTEDNQIDEGCKIRAWKKFCALL